jgi:hypothetical protein
MNNYEFLTIWDVIHDPLVILLLNLFMILSINTISYQICRTKLKISVLNVICTNLFLIFLIISFTQFIYFFEVYPRTTVKILSFILFFFGIVCLFINFNNLKNIKIEFKKQFSFIYLFILFYFLISISTVTDIDSLDYHLGAPLEWFRNQSFQPRYDWLHYRGASLGEVLNLFGLHFGSDNFGQIIQFSGLLIVLIISNIYLKKKNILIFSILILSCPVLIFLTSTQKYQLFASSLVYFALVLSILINKNYNRYFLATILFILSFCITIKVNYFIPSLLIFSFCFVIAFKKKELAYFCIFSITSFLLISFPHLLKNFLFYGDPLTPLFENFKKISDPVILEFSRLERNFAFTPNDNFLSKFLKLFITLNPGEISRILGIGMIGILFIKFNKINNDAKIMLSFIIITFVSYLILFIGMGRYYLEIFFVSALLLASVYNHLKFKSFFEYLIVLQSVFIFFAIGYGVYFLSPSSISAEKKHQIKIIAAEGYDLYYKLDNILPKESRIFIENSRSYSLVPREFVSNNYFKTAKHLNPLLNSDNIIKNNDITHILTKNSKHESSCINKKYKHKITTQRASRNPLNSRAKVMFFVYEVDKSKC